MVQDINLDKAYVSVAVNIGTLDCPTNYDGLPHFLEHMLFLGSSKYPKENHYQERLTALGGTSNAFTAHRETCYFFNVFNEGLEEMIEIFSRFFIGRPLVCYLPIAFNHVYGVNNNIGIIFIELLENDTIDTFNKRFEQNKYQALATNFVLLNNLNKLSVYNGSSVRQNVDIVITSIYHNNNDTEKPAMVYWTYKNVAEYPIYVAISSCVMEEKIVVSQTITSNIGKINLPAYYKEIDCNYFTE